jgi:nitrogen fixation protein
MGGAPVPIAKSTVLALASTAPRMDPKSPIAYVSFHDAAEGPIHVADGVALSVEDLQRGG